MDSGVDGSVRTTTLPRVRTIERSLTQRGSRWLHRQPMVILAVLACVGILLDRFVGIRWGVMSLWVIGSAVWTLWGPVRGRTFAAMLVVVPCFAMRHHLETTRYDAAELRQHIGDFSRPAIVQAVVDRPPTFRRHPLADQRRLRNQPTMQTRFEVTVSAIRIGKAFRSTRGRAMVTVDQPLSDLRCGDAVTLLGELSRFQPASNPGQPDLQRVYRQRRLHGRIHVDDAAGVITSAADDKPAWWAASRNWIGRFAGELSRLGRQSLLRHTDASSGPLAMALILGQRDNVDPLTRDQLLVTGTVHLLSVSGLHLAIVVVMAGWLATFVGARVRGRVVLILLTCLVYTAVTGGRPPVVRASILVAVYALSLWVQRPAVSINSLGLAALLLLLWNPTLIESIGVQLSFIAVSTLIICGSTDPLQSEAVRQELSREEQLDRLIEKSSPPIAYHARRIWTGLRNAFAYSAAVTLVSAPLVWHQFHVISPISVLANVLLGPWMFIALASGLVTIALEQLWMPLGLPSGWICHQTILVMRWIVQRAAEIPGGHFWLPSPPTWCVVGFYVALIVALLSRGIGRSTNPIQPTPANPLRRRSLVVALSAWGLWVVMAWWLSTTPVPMNNATTESIFVDVGHGTAVVMRFDQDDVWLYDCGHLGNDLGESHDIDGVLWSLGTTHLSGIVLSHADSDHFNALPSLLNRFDVDQIITPPGMMDEPDEPALLPIRAAIRRHRVPVKTWSVGDHHQRDRADLVTLHPPKTRLAGSDNANSLVLQINAGSTWMMLPGDLEPPGTMTLVNGPRPSPGGVMMAPHHGSLAADSDMVLRWARPSKVVVSGGRRALHPDVENAMQLTGSDVAITRRDAAVRVRLFSQGPDQIQIRRWNQNPW
ncbi:ComEC/Rec2 family competence protein [Crateriforma conspicua]|uniref:ComEC/Rec2 family competence protein n=1 Tax=Crateriforma conspicua TaxID=2527996 RepID=UPI00118BFCD8|nr:ComEC/Rec2 family competence protein [Crateriforma conspicua]QDV66311.1 ComEC family competence protein [Crateriforma conspicua]